jgi:hypothetical protein
MQAREQQGPSTRKRWRVSSGLTHLEPVNLIPTQHSTLWRPELADERDRDHEDVIFYNCSRTGLRLAVRVEVVEPA